MRRARESAGGAAGRRAAARRRARCGARGRGGRGGGVRAAPDRAAAPDHGAHAPVPGPRPGAGAPGHGAGAGHDAARLAPGRDPRSLRRRHRRPGDAGHPGLRVGRPVAAGGSALGRHDRPGLPAAARGAGPAPGHHRRDVPVAARRRDGAVRRRTHPGDPRPAAAAGGRAPGRAVHPGGERCCAGRGSTWTATATASASSPACPSPDPPRPVQRGAAGRGSTRPSAALGRGSSIGARTWCRSGSGTGLSVASRYSRRPSASRSVT